MRRRWSVAWVVGLALTCLSAGCSSPDAGPEPGSAPAATQAPTPGSDAATTAPPPTGNPPADEPVTLAFAGDVHFEGSLRPLLNRPRSALRGVSPALADADLAMVNLETSLGVGGTPDPAKRFTFQAPVSALRALATAGIDVASMANNHALDHGRGPLPGVFDAIEAAAEREEPLDVVGLGSDADDAFAPAVRSVRGTRVALLAANDADADPTADPTSRWAASADTAGTADATDPARLLDAVRGARRSSDVVVVYVHWGVQGQSCPSDAQRSLARRLVSAGADVIVGSHAHVLQGDGRLGPGYVAYGLGNHVWYTQSDRTSLTGVLTLTVRPAATRGDPARVTETAWAPARIGGDGLPRATVESAAADFRDNRSTLRACSGLASP